MAVTSLRSLRHRLRRPPRRSGESEILQLTGMRSRKYGSLERYFVAVAEECTARGWRVVFQYEEPPSSARYVADLRDAGAAILVRRLGPGRVLSAWTALVLIARRRPRIVHLHFCHALTRLGVGLFAHPLGVDLAVATKHSMPEAASRAFVRATYGCLDRILCVSRAIESRLLALGAPPGRLVTHYLGVPDLDPLPAGVREDVRRRLGIPAASPVIATVAFDNPMKGVDVLTAAFEHHLAAAFPDLHLVIVGVSHGDPGAPPGASGSVRVHWAGTQDDVRPFLAASDIYVQPSRAEGLGLAIVEAMRESLPVVASRVGGIPEVVADGQSGLLVPPDSPQDLAAGVAKLLTDADLARRFAAAGRDRWRRQFELRASVRRLVDDHYAPALAGRRGARPQP
jgi:glycosyltransferase involved in cell wall biosynthesis